MDKDIENIINNVTDENIAKLGIMLADADKVLGNAQIEQLNNTPKITEEESKILYDLVIAGKLDEMQKKKAEFEAKNQEAGKGLEVKIANAKVQYRQLGIAFDIIKTIIENRKVNTMK